MWCEVFKLIVDAGDIRNIFGQFFVIAELENLLIYTLNPTNWMILLVEGRHVKLVRKLVATLHLLITCLILWKKWMLS